MDRRTISIGAALVAILVAAGVLAACSGHDAADTQPTEEAPSAGVELRTSQPSYPAGELPQIELILRNNGAAPCALPAKPEGSVEILSVRRNDTAVLGVQARLDLYDGMAAVVAESLRTVEPGESITLPLSVESDSNGAAVIISTNQTDADDGRTTTWPLNDPGRYWITARLVPVSVLDRPDLPGMCEPPADAATMEFEIVP